MPNLVSNQANNHPIDTQQTIDQSPHTVGNKTAQQDMITRFCIPLAQVITINQDSSPPD